jgi:hypothetical protein
MTLQSSRPWQQRLLKATPGVLESAGLIERVSVSALLSAVDSDIAKPSIRAPLLDAQE